MPRRDPADRPARASRRVPLAGALAIEFALLAALLPSLRVIVAGPWLPAALALAALVLAVGLLSRWLRWPAPLVALAEIVAWAVATTAAFFAPAALWGSVPTTTVAEQAVATVRQTLAEMAAGFAPIPATPAVTFFVVAATGALALVLDYVVLTTRLPLLGSIALLAVALAPSVAVTGPVETGWFVLLAVAILLLLWTEQRRREGSSRRLWSGSTLGAITVGAVAVAIALVVTPLLPAPAAWTTAGREGVSGIDPTLDFGQSLRRPNPVEVLRVRTSLTGAPYLRAATLSTFEGRDWQPDAGDVEPLAGGRGFGAVSVADGIPLLQVETHIEIDRLRTAYLPMTFPATAVSGLEGDWGIVRENRTVLALDADSTGQDYDLVSTLPRPTLDQVRAAGAGAQAGERYTALPADLPPIIGRLADQVTAATTNDYDAAIALQRWFRSSEFAYSLDAPVEDGFDGAGVDAIAEFLRVREGYCVHFASAFALMTRHLGMPTRVVVGYLPGQATGRTADGQAVYSVTSDKLHAWPEVYFDGIGWIGFEPTNSLGVPTTFTNAGGSDADQIGEEAATAEPSETPAPEPTTPEAAPPEESASGTAAPGATGTGWWEPLLIAVGVAGVLAAPGLLGALRRRRRLRDGDAPASWLLAQETAIDLGVPAPASDTPREFGERLRTAGAPADAVAALVSAVEHASYAPASAADAGPVAAAKDAAVAVRAGLLAAAGPGRRTVALLAPRSLLVRPGGPLSADRPPERR